MTATVQARTARVPHLCDSCHWVTGRRGRPLIAPGHRYLRHVAFPDNMVNQSGHPVAHLECVSCASERDSNAALLDAGACGTFCCGVTPCARPFRHSGDCSCLRCVASAGSEAVSP